MRTLAEYIRLYFIIEAQYIKARMQYRADFIISSVGMFFSSLATLGVFWVILQSVPDLSGWTLMEMIFIYAFYMIAISPMQILFDHAWNIRFHVQQGTFLKYYFRPLNMMFYYMSEMFDLQAMTTAVGFMNAEAWDITRKTGYVTFFSRTRNTLWTKGETSGNRLQVTQILVDCDDDTLLVKVTRLGDGNVCHTGERTCFFRALEG